MNVLLLLGIAVLWISLLADVIAVAIPYWIVYDIGSMEMNQGLFQTCFVVLHLLGTKQCAYLNTNATPDWWKAVQALMILSLLAISSAVGLAALTFILAKTLKQKQLLGLLSALLGVAGAGLIIVGVIIYAVKTKDIGVDYHAGFGLAIVASIFAMLGSAIMFVSRNHNN